MADCVKFADQHVQHSGSCSLSQAPHGGGVASSGVCTQCGWQAERCAYTKVATTGGGFTRTGCLGGGAATWIHWYGIVS